MGCWDQTKFQKRRLDLSWTVKKTAGGKSDKQRQRGKSEDSKETAEVNTVGSFIKKNSEHNESRS